jgi:hypothetical protein
VLTFELRIPIIAVNRMPHDNSTVTITAQVRHGGADAPTEGPMIALGSDRTFELTIGRALRVGHGELGVPRRRDGDDARGSHQPNLRRSAAGWAIGC